MWVRVKRIVLLLGFVLVLCRLSWDMVGMWVVPKLVLRSELQKTVSELESRIGNHPVTTLAELMDTQGKYDAELDLSFSNIPWRISRFRGNVALDLMTHRFKATGDVISGEETCRMSVYLDRNVAAIQSDKTGGERFYGIAYDSFYEDLGSLPLVSLFVEMPVFAQWKSGMDRLQTLMEKNVEIPSGNMHFFQFPKALLNALLILPCKVESSDCWLAPERSGCRITYSLDEKTLRILERVGIALNGELKRGEVSFVLYKNELAEVCVEAEGTFGHHRLELKIMENAETGKAELRYTGHQTESENGISLGISSIQGRTGFTENWSISREGQNRPLVLTLTGDKSTTSVSAEGLSSVVMLRKSENGVCFSVSDLMELFNRFLPEDRNLQFAPRTCTVTLRKGHGVRIPEYRHLRNWSLEEFTEVLTALAPFFGWKL